jgi:hypothetical protein
MPDYKKATVRAARKYNVNPAILLALIQQESGFNPRAHSPAGAEGIAQFMPGTAPGYGVNLHDNRVTDDLEGAAKYIASNLRRTGGNYHQALSIYNSGRPDAYKDPHFAGGQTYNYVKTILANAKNFGGVRGEAAPAAAGSGAASPVETRAFTTKTFDKGGYDQARRLAILGQHLAKRNPNNPLLRLGIVGTQLPDLTDFEGTKTQTVTGPTGPPSSDDGGTTGGTTVGIGHRPASQLLEEIYNTGGGGFAVKNGQKVSGPGVYGAVWGGHKDHVHIATGRKQVVWLGKLAQSMGLHVGENPHFGGVNPVHAPNSYHYKGEAIDVSGDPRKMAAFARRVEQIYGVA